MAVVLGMAKDLAVTGYFENIPAPKLPLFLAPPILVLPCRKLPLPVAGFRLLSPVVPLP